MTDKPDINGALHDEREALDVLYGCCFDSEEADNAKEATRAALEGQQDLIDIEGMKRNDISIKPFRNGQLYGYNQALDEIAKRYPHLCKKGGE